MYKKAFNFVFNLLAILSSIFTVFGLSIFQLGVDDSLKSWIVFSCIILLILFLFWRVYLVTKKILGERYPNGYLPIATFARYSTSDGKKINYELFRHIQVKKPYMSEFEHKFFWSGSKDPKISSKHQTIKKTKPNEEEDGEKNSIVLLELRDTLLYNSCDVIHLSMDIDDSDQKSGTFLSHTVKEPIKSIHFRVELLHMPQDYHKKAVLSCQELAKPKSTPEKIREIDFDPVSRSYSELVSNPKAGYCYTLTWERE